MSEQFPRDAEILDDALIELPRRDVALLLETGYLLIEFQRFKEAEEVFSGVSILLPKSDIPHIALGNLYFSQGQFDKALKSHKRASELRPQSALAFAHTGECYLALHKNEDGTKALEKALQLEPEGPTADFAKNLLEAKELGIFDKLQ